MKSLLLKDIYLTTQKRKFILIIAFVAAFILFVQKENGISFAMGYVSILCMELTLSTFTTDESDQSIVFLLTLPVNSTVYVTEKYLFSFLCSISGWLICTASCIAVWPAHLKTTLLQAAVILALMILAHCMVLPVQIKFGSDKGRIVLLGSFIFVLAVFGLLDHLFSGFLPSIYAVTDAILNIHPLILTACTLISALFFVTVSWSLSRSIMRKKDF